MDAPNALFIVAIVAIVAGSAVNALTAWSMLRVVTGSRELLSQAMDTLKAQSLEERVQAKAIEKETDVRIELLRDALDDPDADVDTEPKMAQTADGRVIDLRNWEVV